MDRLSWLSASESVVRRIIAYVMHYRIVSQATWRRRSHYRYCTHALAAAVRRQGRSTSHLPHPITPHRRV